MATILLTWELGGGSGHLMQLMPIARSLARRGHRIHAALRDLSKAPTVFGPGVVRFLQAPYKSSPPRVEMRRPKTMAHIFHNTGFADVDELGALCEAWRGLFDLVRPDLVLCDHSPTALLAARGRRGMRRATLGSGFLCPPDQHPLPNLRFWVEADPAELRRDEDRILANANAVTGSFGDAPPLSHLMRLYAEVDASFLLTFKELDHYPDRRGPTKYWGAWTRASGAAPRWPEGSGRKIYAYLKKFDALAEVLEQLNRWGHPTLIYADGIDAETRARFASATLRFSEERLDMSEVGRRCDLAILNGTHGTTLSMLMAGKPTMQVPIFLEQGLFGHAVKRTGAALDAPMSDAKLIVERLGEMLESDRFAAAARDFARKYADFDPERQNEAVVDEIERVLARPPAGG